MPSGKKLNEMTSNRSSNTEMEMVQTQKSRLRWRMGIRERVGKKESPGWCSFELDRLDGEPGHS